MNGSPEQNRKVKKMRQNRRAASPPRGRGFRASLESLEARTLLTKYAGFGQYVESTLQSLDSIALNATATPLPGIASALSTYLKQNPLLDAQAQAAGAIDDSNVGTAAAEAALLQTALGVPVTPVGDTFELMLNGGTNNTPLSVPVSSFDSGLPVLGFTAATSFDASLSYSLDLTVGTTGTTPAGFFAEATRANNDPLDMTVTLPSSAVPTLNGMYGPFHARAVPASGVNLLGLTYSMNLTSQTFTNGTALEASPVLNGSADEQFGLTLGFAALDSSGLNPELDANFELNWMFSDSPAEASSLDQFGEAPTVSLSEVSMDLKPVLDNTINQLLTPILTDIKPLVTLANVFAKPNPAPPVAGRPDQRFAFVLQRLDR